MDAPSPTAEPEPDAVSANAGIDARPRVDVLLATYNAGRFLDAQLASLRRQVDVGVRIIARDGGSDDGTDAALAAYAQDQPEGAFRLLPGGRAGARENFGLLLDDAVRHGSAEWLAFADQDDVWDDDKLKRTLAAARAAAVTAGDGEHHDGATSRPTLAFTDARVVDEHGVLLAPSSMRRQGLDPTRRLLRQVVAQNVASGNTMVFNRALAIRAWPIPPEAVMHDHWLALVAAVVDARVAYVDRPTMDYRQHGANVFGAAEFSWRYFGRRAREGRASLRARFFANARQAGALAARAGDGALPPSTRRMLLDFASLPTAGVLRKRWILARHRIAKTGWRRNIGTWLMV